MGAQHLLNPSDTPNLTGTQALGLICKDGTGAPLGSGFLSRGFSSCCPLLVQTKPPAPNPQAPGDLDIMEEHASGTKVPGDLTGMKILPQTPPTSIPKALPQHVKCCSLEKLLLWPCQAQQSRGQPVTPSPALPARVFIPSSPQPTERPLLTPPCRRGKLGVGR